MPFTHILKHSEMHIELLKSTFPLAVVSFLFYTPSLDGMKSVIGIMFIILCEVWR